MSFKDKNLDRDKINQCLTDTCGNGEKFDFKKKGNCHHCSFENSDNEELCLLIFYFKNGGKTTISIGNRGDKELARQKAQMIVDVCETNGFDTSCTFKGVQVEVFKLLDQYIEEEYTKFTCESKDCGDGCLRFIITSEHDDSVVVTNYLTTSTALIQGRPLKAFGVVREFFTTWLGEDQLIKSDEATFNVSFSKDEREGLLNELMPTAYPKLNSKVRKILLSSVVIEKINIDLDDFSMFIYPTLRGLEGHIRSLLNDFYDGSEFVDKIGSLFDKKNDTHVIRPMVSEKIGNEKVVKALEKAYVYYYKYRHSLFHVDPTPGTSRIVKGKEAAVQINYEIFKIIEENHRDVE